MLSSRLLKEVGEKWWSLECCLSVTATCSMCNTCAKDLEAMLQISHNVKLLFIKTLLVITQTLHEIFHLLNGGCKLCKVLFGFYQLSDMLVESHFPDLKDLRDLTWTLLWGRNTTRDFILIGIFHSRIPVSLLNFKAIWSTRSFISSWNFLINLAWLKVKQRRWVDVGWNSWRCSLRFILMSVEIGKWFCLLLRWILAL